MPTQHWQCSNVGSLQRSTRPQAEEAPTEVEAPRAPVVGARRVYRSRLGLPSLLLTKELVHITIDPSQFAVLPAWALLVYVLIRGRQIEAHVVIR